MPTEPQQTDIVSEARELDGWGILAMPPSCAPEMLTFDGAKRIDGLLRQLCDEVERLKRGDFTAEEFQNLCHGLSGDDRGAFFEGCTRYQEQLFGTSAVAEARKENQ